MTTGNAGRYELQECVGRGGMGSVWRGRDPMLARTVAVKLLDVPPADDPQLRAEYLERFMREAHAAARLVHPNIVGVFDTGVSDDGRPFLVMEFVDGSSLDAELARGPLDPTRVATIGEQLARALDAAHRAGIVHRDVKPANALCAPDGTVKLMDFGIARLTESTLTGRGQYLGSPRYSSPEQIAGLAVDARSDVFSLALTLYVLLTGSYPFPTNALTETVRAIAQDELAPPSFLLPELSPMWDAVLQRGLAKDPARRVASAAEFAESLAALRTISRTSYEVLVVDGPDAGLRALLDEAIEIGRGSAALPLTDTTVSSRHCRIERRGNQVVVTDLASANGTWVDGVRAAGTTWATGTVVDVGRRTRLKLVTSAVPTTRASATELDAAPTATHVLVVKSGPAAGRRQALQGPVRIGRDQGDLVVDDSKVSRAHAVVEPRGVGLYLLKDLASANGTWLGERRVTDAELRPGDSFRIGGTVLAIEPA